MAISFFTWSSSAAQKKSVYLWIVEWVIVGAFVVGLMPVTKWASPTTINLSLRPRRRWQRNGERGSPDGDLFDLRRTVSEIHWLGWRKKWIIYTIGSILPTRSRNLLCATSKKGSFNQLCQRLFSKSNLQVPCLCLVWMHSLAIRATFRIFFPLTKAP